MHNNNIYLKNNDLTRSFLIIFFGFCVIIYNGIFHIQFL